MNRLQWYFRRLRAMPPAEIIYRFQHAIHAARLSALGPPFSKTAIRLPASIRVALEFRDEVLTPLEQCHPYYEQVRARAQSSRRHTFSLLGAPERDFGTPVDWTLDPLSGMRWPRDVLAFRIDYRHMKELGEVKYVWELGRMPWLVPWAIAARLYRDSVLARSVIEEILAFVRNNPAYCGVHWTSGIEMAVRLVAWTWALALVAPLALPTEEEWKEISYHVALAADFCWRFRSLYSSANNHLIAEGAALEIVGIAWPWLPKSKTFLVCGRRILDHEIPRQILADGGSIEMCPAYLLEVLTWSLVVARLRKEHGIPIPSIWLDRWQAAANLLENLCANEEALPSIGDNDEGEVLPTGMHLSPRDFAQVLRAVRDSGETSSATHVPLFALIGDGSPTRSQSREVRNLCASTQDACASTETDKQGFYAHLYPACGLLIVRGRNSRLVADFGPHGLPPIYAHAHADALSVILDIEGVPALVDPGTYCYHGERMWRDWFRSTSAHNTLEIGGRNQSQVLGPFLWGHVARTRILTHPLPPDLRAVAEHNGYAPLVHQRAIQPIESNAVPTDLQSWLHGSSELLEGDIYYVRDKLCSSPENPRIDSFSRRIGDHVILWWHFAPGELTLRDGTARWRGERGELRLSWLSSEPTISRVHEGETSPPQGWYSPQFSRKYAAPALEVRIPSLTKLPLIVHTVLVAVSTDPSSP